MAQALYWKATPELLRAQSRAADRSVGHSIAQLAPVGRGRAYDAALRRITWDRVLGAYRTYARIGRDAVAHPKTDRSAYSFSPLCKCTVHSTFRPDFPERLPDAGAAPTIAIASCQPTVCSEIASSVNPFKIVSRRPHSLVRHMGWHPRMLLPNLPGQYNTTSQNWASVSPYAIPTVFLAYFGAQSPKTTNYRRNCAACLSWQSI